MRLIGVTLCCVLLLGGQCYGSAFDGVPVLRNHRPDNQDAKYVRPNGRPNSTEHYPYHAHLDDNYELHWKFNETHITFETIVKTKGYIGFGITPNGAMLNSDVIIGWVKDGQSYFSDRHADGHYMPAKDTHQDWHLVAASESGDYTTLKMVRKLDTCDPQDRPILDGTTRVIYSYHPDDPVSEDAISYHGTTTRGTKSLLLLDPPAEDKDLSSLPGNVKSLEFLNQNYSVPSADTTYHCVLWKMPDLGGKHQMIRFEPVIQKGHEGLLHHIVLYQCTGTFNDFVPGHQFGCYDYTNYVQHNYYCYMVIVAWAVGGTGFDFPSHTGFSFGSTGDPVFMMLETHYDNPAMKSGFVDNSGMRLFITDQLRPNDAGMLLTGLLVSDTHIVPPYEPNFLSTGYCLEECISEGLGDQEIHVFANLLHAHLAGVKLRTRHFRNGVELPPLAEDNSYDFNFQEQRLLRKEITIKKGDSFIVECVYDTTKRTTITYGGLSSRQEMCESFLLYYPKANLKMCLSSPAYKMPPDLAGQEMAKAVKLMDFTKKDVRDAFKKTLAEADVNNMCLGHQVYSLHGKTTSVPSIKQTYQRNHTCPTQ